jgi:hypothetical protein
MLNYEIPIGSYAESLPSDYKIRLAWYGMYYVVSSNRGWEGSFRDLCDARLFIDALEAIMKETG